MNLIISIGFGLVVISMAFLVFVFLRAWHDPEKREDHRYRVVASALALGSLGVGMWAFNPLMQAFGGPALPIPLMFIASALILAAASSLVGSTAMGGSKGTLKWFVITCGLWTVGCILGSMFA